MVCEDIISRVKDELMYEAVEILHGEADSGRIKMDGNLVTSEEGTGEAERDIFILDKLLEDEPIIRSRYENFVKATEEGEASPEVVARIEDVRKFLLAISEISLIVRYARIFSAWFADAGKQMKVSDPSDIFYMTSLHNKERMEALDFVLTSKKFLKSGELKEGELKILKGAYSRLTGKDQ